MGMSSNSNKILKILARKPATSLDSLKEAKDKTASYSINRSVKNLLESGYVESVSSDNKKYLKLTKKGKSRVNYLKLEGDGALLSSTWDGYWRIIIIDLPEVRKSEREALRYLLKKANFVCIKNTVWISPFPYEHLFTNIKKDLELGTELMIIVSDRLDDNTRKAFFSTLKTS